MGWAGAILSSNRTSAATIEVDKKNETEQQPWPLCEWGERQEPGREGQRNGDQSKCGAGNPFIRLFLKLRPPCRDEI